MANVLLTKSLKIKMKNCTTIFILFLCVILKINAQEQQAETRATENEIKAFVKAVEDSIVKYRVEIIYPKNYNNSLKSSAVEQLVGIMPCTRDVNLKHYPKLIIHMDNEDGGRTGRKYLSTNFDPNPQFEEFGYNSLNITPNQNTDLTFFLVPLRYFYEIIEHGAPFDFAVLNYTTSQYALRKCAYFDRYYDTEDSKTKNYIYIYNMQGTPDGKQANGGYCSNYIGRNIKLSFIFFKATNKAVKMPSIPGLDSYYVFGRFGHYQHWWNSDDENRRNANKLNYYKPSNGKHVLQKDKSDLINVGDFGKNTILFYSLVDHTNML